MYNGLLLQLYPTIIISEAHLGRAGDVPVYSRLLDLGDRGRHAGFLAYGQRLLQCLFALFGHRLDHHDQSGNGQDEESKVDPPFIAMTKRRLALLDSKRVGKWTYRGIIRLPAFALIPYETA
jgi:hypothetical protein